MGTTVKTIGVGGDYTTLQSWEDAAPANLVTDGNIWQGKIKASTDNFSAQLTISGSTTDSTHYKHLTTATGASWRDNANVRTNALKYNTANGCYISAATYNAPNIIMGENYARLSNLQVKGTNTYGSSAVQLGNTGCLVEFCILVGHGGYNSGTVYLSGGPCTVNNCMVTVYAGTFQGLIHVQTNTNPSVNNCTFAAPSDLHTNNGIYYYYSSVTFNNCTFFGINALTGGTGSHTETYANCFVETASPPSGCTQATYNTSLFVGVTNAAQDLRIPSGSALVDAGNTDSTNAPTDITGLSRPQGSAYDVGCWELAAAAAAAALPKNRNIGQAVNRAGTY